MESGDFDGAAVRRGARGAPGRGGEQIAVGWAKAHGTIDPRGQNRGCAVPTRTARCTRFCPPYGRIANALAGKPSPFFTFGQVTTISAPVGGTLSRFAITSIW